MGGIAYRRRGGLPYVCGVLAPLFVYGVANYLEAGTLLGPHAAANLAPLTDRWAAARADRARLWLLPRSSAHVLGFLPVAAGWLAHRCSVDRRRAQLLALLGATVMTAASAAGVDARDSLWRAWPVGLLLLVPQRAGERSTAPFWWLAAFTTVAIWLSSTHDGGAQWGPRFLLISTPALIILAAASASDAVGPGWGRLLRQLLVVVIIVCGAWTTRAAYRDLRGTKRYYSRLVTRTAAVAPPGSHVVFRDWWFDQVVASLYPGRTFLYADSTAGERSILKALENADVRFAVLAWSREVSAASQVLPGPAGTCFRNAKTLEVPKRQMTFVLLRCAR